MRDLNNLQFSAFWGFCSSHKPAGDVWKTRRLRTKSSSLVYMKITDVNCPRACMAKILSATSSQWCYFVFVSEKCGGLLTSSDLHGKAADTSIEMWWMAGGTLGRTVEPVSASNFFSLSPWRHKLLVLLSGTSSTSCGDWLLKKI